MNHFILRSMAVLLCLSTGVRAARADERGAAMQRDSDEVITMPTAFMLSSTNSEYPAAALAGRIDHRGAASARGTIGLGGIAQLTFSTARDVRVCETCTADETLRTLRMQQADFRMGAPAHAWFRGQPALALGVRVAYRSANSVQRDVRAVDAYVVASERLGPITLHAGALLEDFASTTVAGRTKLSDQGFSLRPMVGLEWHPAPYPRTTLLGDLTWVPEVRASGITQTWLAGWGVRYQAARSVGVELSVRHRQDEGLADTTVLVGARIAFAPK
jgi:hypothetical protein